MTITVYGIRNCNTMKKAFDWLTAAGVDYQFHDYKKAGISAGKLAGWSAAVGWERLVNRSGTTFRALPEAEREGLDEARALALLAEKPSMIRRPLIETGEGIVLGFDAEDYGRRFGGG